MGDLSTGSIVAGYRIEGLLGRGGMGVVYRATHLTLERPVALKVIARDLVSKEGFRARFLRESRLAASLDHPAVVPIYDSREVDGELVVAMRLVEGGDLRRMIDRDGPLEPERAIALLGQVADALDAAHAAGIVHRDVKPHNVLVEGERAFLSDFGLAKALGESGAASSASVVGTVEYMSPEQWRGSRVGPPADVYSLGCVLYEALTGVAPFGRREDDTEPELPAGLEAVIERAVAKDPAERYPSAGMLIAAAREVQGAAPAATRVLYDSAERPTVAAPPSPAPRRGPTRQQALWLGSGGIALIAVLAALVFLVFGDDGLSVSEPIPVGTAPLRIAAASDAIWVTSERDGTLTRLNPASGERVGEPLRLRRGIAGVAVGGGSVWVTDPPRGEVLRIDPDTVRVVGRIEVGGKPGPIVFGGGRVWVADGAGTGVAAIDARGGEVFRRRLPPHTAPLRLAVGAGGLWVSSASTGAVRRLDLRSANTEPPIPVGRGPAGVTVAGGLVWVADSRGGGVTTVDPVIRSVVGTVEIGGHPGGIDAGTSTVWVASVAEDTVTRIDIESGERIGEPIAVGSEPGAVAVGGEAVWVADNGEGAVTRIEP
ncbi:MAG TPA: serine/threonine-protein kinase [Solirubrobacterales bacterium]|nr:serine/threonine-protein kinase [Solirubrobacterales bacterium]